MSVGRTDTSTNAPKAPNRRRGVAAWFGVRDRRVGGRAFIANRVVALGLVAYLYVHLGVLSLLAVGEGAYDTFVDVATHPLLLVLDVVLIAGLVGHGLYGLRSVLVGSGLVNGRGQRALVVGLAAVGAVVVLVAAVLLFT